MIIKTQPINDFTVLALQNNLKLEKIYRESVMEIMNLESEYIENCLEMGQIVSEALDATEVEVTKKRGIFQRILDAIQALFGTFKEKVTVLMDKNEQWLKANMTKVTKDRMSGLGEVELIPYWTIDVNKIGDVLLSELSANLINRTKGSPEKYASMEELTKIVRQTVGGNGDLATDTKNFFRTSKPGVAPKPVKITGAELSKHLDEMYNYILQYDKIVVPRLNRFMTKLKNTVKSLESSAKLESFCFLENAMYNETEIGVLPNFGIVLEANKGETKDGQLSNGSINDNQKNQSLTSVTVNKSGEEGSQGQKENSAKLTEYCKNLTNVLKILQGAALTVLEEKYITYINLFKAVINNTKSLEDLSDPTPDDDTKLDETKQKETKKEESKKEEPKKKKKKGLFFGRVKK